MVDFYQTVTDQIIASIEAGVTRNTGPLWRGQGASGIPMNRKTRAHYSGINVLLLWLSAQDNGFASNYWLTFKQAKELGGNVKKGAKGTHIVYYKTLEREEVDATSGESETRLIPMLRQYVVFNLDQIEGIQGEEVTSTGFDGIEAAEFLIAKSGARIVEGGTRAFYRPVADVIHMPDRERFDSAENFYAVELHELTHWTGHSSRLARDFSGRFGDQAYAFEELVAEIGATYACADLGLATTTLPNHARYIASWLKVLRDDKKAIFTAASQAAKAHAYLMNLANPVAELEAA